MKICWGLIIKSLKTTKIFLFIIPIFLISCEKKIDFQPNEQEPKLVVEATIENGQPPVVTLMKSIGYFSEISTEILVNSFVHNAAVFVSDGIRTHQLKEYNVPIGNGLFLSYYSIDTSNLATAIYGQLKQQYSLRIVVEGKEYTAKTTIPDITKKIDSLWWKPSPGNPDTTEVLMIAKITDPPGYGDYIRYYTRINSQPAYLPPDFATYDDLFIDGSTYEVVVQPGIDRNSDSTESDFFHRGDTVNFKISNIDKASFDFWRTWESSYSSIGNPFSTPTKVLGNISNNALGYFAGYASQFRTIIIPK